MFKDKLVLITGGTGFIGTNFTRSLLERGARIRIPIHQRQPTFLDSWIETVPADLKNFEDCLKVSQGADYVIHAAGAVGSASSSPTRFMDAITTNLVITLQMLQASWEKGVKGSLIFSSSTGYPVAEYPIKESEFWGGELHSSYFGYGWMRRYLEKISTYVNNHSNMKVFIARPTAVFGPHDNFDPVTSHVIPALIRKAVEKMNPYEVWGNGEEVRDFLFIDDFVRGCLLIMEKGQRCDPVNIGYGKTMSIKDVVQLILKVTGHQAPIEFNTTKPSAIPFRMVDTTKAKNLLGFEPAFSLEQGLKITADWFKNYCLTKTS